MGAQQIRSRAAGDRGQGFKEIVHWRRHRRRHQAGGPVPGVEARDVLDLFGVRAVALLTAAPVDVHVDVAGHEPAITELDELVVLT